MADLPEYVPADTITAMRNAWFIWNRLDPRATPAMSARSPVPLLGTAKVGAEAEKFNEVAA